jgi:superfamily II DNA or RNA helicase
MTSLPSVDEFTLNDCVLRDYQISAVSKGLYWGRGIVQAPTGSGKTLIAAAIITHLFERGLSKRVLYLCPQGFIAEQTGNKFKQWGLPGVCVVGYGHRYKPGAKVYVCVVDSAYKRIREESTDLEKVDLLMLDEAHHAKATRWTYICEKLHIPRRLAFTATAFEDPDEYCYDDLVLQGLTGPIIYNISSKVLRDQGYLAHPVVCMLRPNSGNIPVWDWNTVYRTGIVANKKRNSLIVSLADSCYQGNYRTMIFVGQVKHGNRIAEELAQHQGVECAFVQGNKQVSIWMPSGKVRKYKWSVDQVAHYINNRERAVMIATTVLDEGFDVPLVNVLIMATAMKKYRRTIQRAGRGMRPKEGDNRVFIFDFYDDSHIFLENHSKKRIWTYGVEEFKFVDSLDHIQEMMGVEITLDRNIYYRNKKRKKKND